jgi:hypothetical protein
VGAKLAVELYLFDFVESFCGEVSLAAVGTRNQRYVLDQKEVLTLAECFRDSANTGSALATIVTKQLTLLSFHIV